MHRRVRSPTSPTSIVSSSGISELETDPVDLRRPTDTNTRVGLDTLLRAKPDAECTATGLYCLQVCDSRQLCGYGNQSLAHATTSVGCSAFGYASLQCQITGNDCSAFGYMASKDTVSHENSAFGAYSQLLIYDGSQNTSYGAYTLSTSISSSKCVALGTRCMHALLSGDNNTGCGSYALSSVGAYSDATAFGAESQMRTTVGQNTSIGTRTLKNSQFGKECTVSGYEACMTALNPLRATAYGYKSMHSAWGVDNTMTGAYTMAKGHTNGFENTGNGAYSLYACQGSRNSALGYKTLTELEIGVDNSAMGCHSLLHVVSGNKNTACGANTGEGIISSHGHTMLGYGSGPSSDGFNNTLCLGVGARASHEGEIVVGSLQHPYRTINLNTINPSSPVSRYLRITLNGIDVLIPCYDMV